MYELKLTDKGRKFRRMAESSDQLGRKLRRARIKAGLSQWQLADKVGAVQQQITDYELGKRRPRKARLEQLCKILGLEL